MNPENIQPREPPSRHSQMFWGAITYNGRTSLAPLIGDPESPGGGVTRRRILQCLQENLPTIAEPGHIFTQDNAPTHKARLVQNWLVEWADGNGIGLVQWPAYSPDLNPIENVWYMVKRMINERHLGLKSLKKNTASLQRLIEAAIECWEDYDQEAINHLIDSMPRRLQAVIDNNGWYTKY